LNYIIILKIIIKMDKLKKLIVYRIDGINYIGSTIIKLRQRELNHISSCYNKFERHYTTPLYIHIREKSLEIKLIPIAYYFVSNKSRRYAEQYWINKHDSVNNGLNVINAYKTITHKEANEKYREKNKEIIKKKQKEYREKNKDKIRKRISKKINCPKCNCVVSKGNISTHQKSKKCKKLMLLHHQL